MRYNDTNLEAVLFSVFFYHALIVTDHSLCVCFLLAISPHLDLTELTFKSCYHPYVSIYI
jgi:hypothetical protein